MPQRRRILDDHRHVSRQGAHVSGLEQPAAATILNQLGHAALPLLIAITSIAGLLSALLGDGVYDWASWLGLGIPVAAVIHAFVRRT